MFMTCLGVLSMVTHLRTFSSEQVLVARESESGVSMSAFFVSQNMIDLLWVFTAPAIMLGPYYYLTLPVSDCQTSPASHASCLFHNTLHCVNTNSSYLHLRGPQQRIPSTQPAPATARLACHPAPVPPGSQLMPFARYYLVSMCVCWWTSGAAYLVSALLPPSTVLMSGVFVSLILGAFIQVSARQSMLVSPALGHCCQPLSRCMQQLLASQLVTAPLVSSFSQACGCIDLSIFCCLLPAVAVACRACRRPWQQCVGRR